MSKKEKALHYFSNGFNCSQAVVVAFAKEIGIDEDMALKMATSFGGGMRMGEVCGAATGALMVIGLMKGHSVEGDVETKERAYAFTREFNRRFKEKHGHLRCKELLGYDLSNDEEYAILKEKEVFKTICPKFVESAVEIVKELMKDKQSLTMENLK